ncbi:MAG: hypothetical protein AAGD01_01680 [Acidobacteriota bacterium]
MTVTCPTWGPIWGSQHMATSLAHLDELGVEWVSIHPYAGINRQGKIQFRPTAELGFLDRAAEMIQQREMHFFLKPHLAYWGSFEWRGEIEFEKEEDWRRFFTGYRAFIVDQARFAQRQGVPLFAVGTELEATTHREAEWREIIAAVRQVYDGSLIYAANWDRLDRVPFWDAVDAIGVQAYYPLSEDEVPDRCAVEKGWKRPLAQLAALSRRFGDKPVIFTEIGYNRAPEAAREPWSYRVQSTAESRELRRVLMDVALERLEGDPVVRGVFWWKWMPGPSAGKSNFSMRDSEAIDALRQHWLPPQQTR